MKFLIKYKIIVAVVAYAIFIWALFFFVINPLIGQVSLEADKSQEDILDRENKEKRAEELPKLKEQYQMVEKEESKIKIFLTRDKAIDLIRNLEDLAEKTGNKISIEVDEKAQTGNEKNTKKIIADLPKLEYLKLKITLLGNYNNMVNFMTKLENFDYYSDIISISIDQGDSSGNSSIRDLFGRSTSNSGSGEKNNSGLLKSELVGLFYLEGGPVNSKQETAPVSPGEIDL